MRRAHLHQHEALHGSTIDLPMRGEVSGLKPAVLGRETCDSLPEAWSVEHWMGSK